MIYCIIKLLIYFAVFPSLLVACISTPLNFREDFNNPRFRLFQQSSQKSCSTDKSKPHFSAIIAGNGIPDLPIDGLWQFSKTSSEQSSLNLEVSSPTGETVTSFIITDSANLIEAQILTPPPTEMNDTTNEIIQALATLGPAQLRLLVCGGYITQGNFKQFVNDDEPTKMIINSTLQAPKIELIVQTKLLLPSNNKQQIMAKSTIYSGSFIKHQVGEIEWIGTNVHNELRPISLKFSTGSREITLIFSDFE